MRLTLLPEGLTVACRPDASLLDAALAAGVALPHSCRSGSCGACRATWVSGAFETPAGSGLGLSDEERAAGALLLCRARPRSDVTVEVDLVRAAADVERRRLPCRVVHWRLLSPQVLEIGLKLPAVEPFSWQAGQSIDLILADGTRRAYSIASAPESVSPLLLQVARVPNGHMSGALFALNGPGALLTLEGPYGGFDDPSVPSGGTLVLVAGGTGYAPLRSLLLARFAQGLTEPVRLYFGARERTDLYADAELRALAAQWPHFTYVPVCEQGAASGDVRRGRVTAVVVEEERDLAATCVVAAGPTAMVTALAQQLETRGLPRGRFYADAFG